MIIWLCCFFFLRSRKFYIMSLDSNIKITYYWVCNRIFFFQFHDIKNLEIFISIHSNIYIYRFFQVFSKKMRNFVDERKNWCGWRMGRLSEDGLWCSDAPAYQSREWKQQNANMCIDRCALLRDHLGIYEYTAH